MQLPIVGYLVALLLSALCVLDAHAWHYTCEKNACGRQNKKLTEHLMCDTAKFVNESVENDIKGTLLAVYPNTRRLMDLILHEHNLMRDKIAGGKELSLNVKERKIYTVFPGATAMRELIWDTELEYLAKYHASLCLFDHDKCHATDNFPLGGQNLANILKAKKENAVDIIRDAIREWVDEKNYIQDGDALANLYEQKYKFMGPGGTKTAGHFCQLIHHQVSRVGCALSYCTKCKIRRKKEGVRVYQEVDHCYYLTCDYDFMNIHNLMLYESGEPGSKCRERYKVGMSKSYKNLCHNSGEIFPPMF